MNRIAAMVVFLPLMIGISFMMNFISIISVFYFFGMGFSFSFVYLSLFLSILYLLSAYLEKKYNGFLFRSIFTFASVWFGVIFLFFVMSLLFMVADLIYALPQPMSGAGLISIVIGICTYALLNARTIHVKDISIKVSGLKHDLTILHVSDIHVGSILGKKFLEKVVALINKQDVDFVALTGDLVDGSGPLHHDLYMPLNDIKHDVFFCIGNHEIYENIDSVMKVLKDTKLKVLRDEFVEHKGIRIIGVDYRDSAKNVAIEIEKLGKSEKPSLLLYHAPLSLGILTKNNINLHLAGHTHAGQIFPFGLFVKLAYPFNYGLHTLGDSNAYITSGVGSWGPPMRLGSESEIVRIKLVSK